MRFSSTVAAALLAPTLALAVGFNDDEPPKPTETTITCEGDQVWDAETKSCIAADQSSLNDTERLRAVRELAYAERFEDAEAVLNTVSDPSADGVLTYRGYLARKMGDDAKAFEWYGKALEQNPDNLLARSYLGQAHVKAGNVGLALRELKEIWARGGRETWAEASLRAAIETGEAFSY